MLNLHCHHASMTQIGGTKLSQLKTGWLRIALAVFVVIVGLDRGNARAQIALTPATAADGWTLTTFVTGFTLYGGIGPLGIAFTDAGGVVVTDYGGDVRVFPTDTDGQAVSSVPIAASYARSNAVGLARVGNAFYMTQQGAGHVVQINPDGTLHQVIAKGLSAVTGITVNPNNGHLFISSSNRSWIGDVDPITHKVSVFLTLPYSNADGLTTDGTTLYAASKGHVLGYHLSDKKLIFDSGFILGTDGITLGAGALTGSLFVNTNYGQVFQIDLSTQVITLIATGGGRGDFVTVDPNGSILITQAGRIVRLIPPPGESFESAGVTVQPSIVAGGASSVGTITLSAPAPKSLVVSLTSTSDAILVPLKVTIPAGAITGTFPINTKAVSTTTKGDIVVTLNGISNSVTLTVTH